MSSHIDESVYTSRGRSPGLTLIQRPCVFALWPGLNRTPMLKRMTADRVKFRETTDDLGCEDCSYGRGCDARGVHSIGVCEPERRPVPDAEAN